MADIRWSVAGGAGSRRLMAGRPDARDCQTVAAADASYDTMVITTGIRADSGGGECDRIIIAVAHGDFVVAGVAAGHIAPVPLPNFMVLPLRSPALLT
jgi:hypothetical protein